jgi:hypothetical protein
VVQDPEGEGGGMWQDIFNALKAKDFDRLQQILGRLDILEFLQDPWVIGAMVVISVALLVKNMGKALVTFLSVPALLVLFELTVRGDIDLEMHGDKVLYFAGGFLVIAAVNVYVHFIRS